MFNKVSSIILNSAKSDGLSDIFVAQPDSLKENLAGKAFILAEIGGKRSDGEKLFDFLVTSLNDHYYNDEKILFRDKIEGLKIENIFEAAVAKINKSLTEFLSREKIKLNPAETNITLGVIFENNLHFSNFGRNRALLIYKHGSDYEVINVETNAAETPLVSKNNQSDKNTTLIPKIFSSVISGEIPVNSYFIFSSESLPEYLSNQEMIKIVTKLPPMTAAEQIKNVLNQINTYVPFLGIIVKNVTGLPILDKTEEKELSEMVSSAHTSISSLNNTEAKTEQMLSPAGLINFSKVFSKTKKLLANSLKRSPAPSSLAKKYIKQEEKNKSEEIKPKLKTKEALPESSLNIGKVNSLNTVRANSFIIKDKIFFKKKTGWLKIVGSKLGNFLFGIFSPHSWSNLFGHLKSWTNSLNPKNRWPVFGFIAIVIIFVASLMITDWHHKQQIAIMNFNNQVTEIENQADSINSHLLYQDRSGAKKIYIQAEALLSSLPQKTKDQQAQYQRLASRLQDSEDKINKIVKVASADKVNDVTGLGVNSLVFVSGKIYGAAASTIYSFTPGSSSGNKTIVSGAVNLQNPFYYGSSLIYYWNSNNIVQYNIKTAKTALFSFTAPKTATGIQSYKVFNRRLYLLVDGQNQIYRYPSASASFAAAGTSWLTGKNDLSQASDLYIDGHIYILNKNGQVLKFFKGKQENYSSTPITPVMTNASKLIVGNNNIYIFEAESRRIVVLAKSDGHLLDQYQLNFTQNPKDFTIDEANKTAYVLTNNGIYKLSLTQ